MAVMVGLFKDKRAFKNRIKVSMQVYIFLFKVTFFAGYGTGPFEGMATGAAGMNDFCSFQSLVAVTAGLDSFRVVLFMMAVDTLHSPVLMDLVGHGDAGNLRFGFHYPIEYIPGSYKMIRLGHGDQICSALLSRA